MRHLVSILFDRPSSREMSRFERFVLSVMWPVGAGLLGMAILETVGLWLRFSPPEQIGLLSWGLDVGRWPILPVLARRVEEWPVPQIFALALGLITALLRSGLGLGWGGGKRVEGHSMDLPPVIVDAE